jgi:hypothetical protein
MIDYYYEFHQGSKLFDRPIRYAMMRGYHPEESSSDVRTLHNVCYQNAVRIWLENENGITMVRELDRDTHVKCDPKILTWLKLQAHEL